MGGTQEQGKLVGPVSGDDDRPVPSEAWVEQLVTATDGLYMALQEITRGVQDLHQHMPCGSLPLETSLTILKDRSDRMETNIITLQQTVNLVVDKVSDPRTREKEIMASVVATIMDMRETLETVQEALFGLTQQIQVDGERGGCAWREYLLQQQATDIKAGSILDNLAKIAMLAPKLETIIADDLVIKGYNPESGEKREWVNIQIDKVRTAASTLVINLLAATALGGVLWIWQYRGSQGQVVRLQAEMQAAALAHETEENTILQRNQVLMDQVRDLLAAAKQAPKARPYVDPYEKNERRH